MILRWWKQRSYENQVLAKVMAMTLLLKNNHLPNDPAVRDAIRDNGRKGVPKEVATTHIAASLFAEIISRIDAPRRQQIYDRLSDWASFSSFPPTTQEIERQRAVRKDFQAGKIQEEDGLVTRLQLAFLMAQDWLFADKIIMQDWKILKSEIYGSLKGYSTEERREQRLDEILDNAVR
ncbi:hypothetical protein EOS93_01155 [Rhizobium sp. RMa-01]|nr:hypothetical protein BBJ66_07405 [Rhizobium sp. RSm-3]RVU13724.1 hypothetical protein EOS93_01155 [Rhizobium sp. RMa-01]